MPKLSFFRGCILALLAIAVLAFPATLVDKRLLAVRPELILNATVMYLALGASAAMLFRNGALSPPVRALSLMLFCVGFMIGLEFMQDAYPLATEISSTVTKFEDRRIFTIGGLAFAILSWTSQIQYLAILSPALFERRPQLPWIRGAHNYAVRPQAPFMIGAPVLLIVLVADSASNPITETAVWLVGAMMLAATALGAVLLVIGARSADPDSRRRAMLLIAGVYFYVTMMLLLFAITTMVNSYVDGGPWPYVLSVGVDVAYQLGLLILVLTAIAGVFFQGALDPELVIRRTTIWGGLGILGVFTTAAIGNATQDLLASVFGITGLPATMVLGGLLAVAVLPFSKVLARLSTRAMEWLNADTRSSEGIQLSIREEQAKHD